MNPPFPPEISPSAPKNGLATASLVCGILALPTCWATAIPALITGHIAFAKMKVSGSQVGRKSAKAGLILGYGSLALIPVIAILVSLLAPLILRQREKADQVICITNVRQLGASLTEYNAKQGTETAPYPTDFSQLGLPIEDVERLLTVPARNAGSWLYFPKADPMDPGAALLVSPAIGSGSVVPAGRPHVILTTDGSARLMKGAEIEKLVHSSKFPPTEITAPVR